MIRLLCVLLLVFPASAWAQSPVATPIAGIEEDAPDPVDENADDPVGDEDPVDDEEPVDGEDAYTCSAPGTDADYVYCADAQPGGGGGEPGAGNSGSPRTVTTATTLPANTLPYTGASPALIALLGLSLVMMGAGGRLVTSRSR